MTLTTRHAIHVNGYSVRTTKARLMSFAGASALKLEKASDVAAFKVPAGNYLKFPATGTLPDAVIQLWGDVWKYFSAADCPHQRAYTTDVEHYLSSNDVAIYIAINE